MGNWIQPKKMTRKFFLNPMESSEDTNNDHISNSDNSSIEEPNAPIIRNQKPFNKPPTLILDPDFDDYEFSDDEDTDPHESSIFAWPVRKLLTKRRSEISASKSVKREKMEKKDKEKSSKNMKLNRFFGLFGKKKKIRN